MPWISQSSALRAFLPVVGGGRVEGFRASISKQNGILLRRVYILQEDFRLEFRVLGFGYLDSPVKPQLLKYHLFVSFRV